MSTSFYCGYKQGESVANIPSRPTIDEFAKARYEVSVYGRRARMQHKRLSPYAAFAGRVVGFTVRKVKNSLESRVEEPAPLDY